MGDKRVKILLTQSEIAKAAIRSQSSIHYILNGDRMPSLKTALSLERATGICREAWLFPERHWNPYIPFENIQSCSTCSNRPARINKSIEMAETHFEQAENKREAFKGVVEIYKTYTGLKGAVFVYKEVVPEGFKLLACSEPLGDQPVRDLWPQESFRELHESALNERSIVIPHFPYGIFKSLSKEMNLLFNLKLKSMLFIARDGLLLLMFSDRISLNWTDIGVKNAEKHIGRIAQLWKEYRNKNNRQS